MRRSRRCAGTEIELPSAIANASSRALSISAPELPMAASRRIHWWGAPAAHASFTGETPAPLSSERTLFEHRGKIGGRVADNISAGELVTRAVTPERADRDDSGG